MTALHDFLGPRVGERGRGPRGGVSRALRPPYAALVLAALALTACVATQSPNAVVSSAPGFPLGLWHGFIFPVAWVVSLFDADISIYAVPNNGGWYDFGYFLGVVFLGVGANGARRRR